MYVHFNCTVFLSDRDVITKQNYDHLKKYHNTIYITIFYITNIRDFDKIFG